MLKYFLACIVLATSGSVGWYTFQHVETDVATPLQPPKSTRLAVTVVSVQSRKLIDEVELVGSLEADAAARKNASAFLKSDRKHSLAGRLIKKIRNTEEQLKTKTEGRHKERLTIQIDDMYNRLHRMVGGVGDVNKTVIIPYTQAIIDSSTTSNNLDSTITKVKSDGAVVIPAAGTGVVPIGRYP